VPSDPTLAVDQPGDEPDTDPETAPTEPPEAEPEAPVEDPAEPEPLEEDLPPEEPTDPNLEPVLGMKPDELLGMLRNGQLPKSVAEQLFVDVPIGNGRTQRVNLVELHRGFLRNIDYSRKTEAAAQERKQAQGMLQARQNELQTMRDPTGKGMRRWIEDNGMFEPFFRAAESLASEVSSYQAMSPEQRDAYDRQLANEERERKLQTREQEINQRDQAIRHDQFRRKHEQDLTEMVPRSFERHQLHDSKLAQDLFKGHLGKVVDQLERFDGLNDEIIDMATRLTVETLQEMAQSGYLPAGDAQQPAAQPQTQPRQGVMTPRTRAPGPPPPTALPGAPRTGPARPTNGSERARISGFGVAMQKLNRGR
jgi:hypothetical protein